MGAVYMLLVLFTEMDLMESPIAGLGEHRYADGICAPAVPAPPDASQQGGCSHSSAPPGAEPASWH